MIKEIALMSVLLANPIVENSDYIIKNNIITQDYTYSLFNEINDDGSYKYENNGYGTLTQTITRKHSENNLEKPVLDEQGNPVLDEQGNATYEQIITYPALTETDILKKDDIVIISVENYNSSINSFYDFNVNVYCNSNAITITKDTENVYKFTLNAVGTYDIKANWTISNTIYKKLLDVSNDAVDGNWSKVFSIENIVLLIYGIIILVSFLFNLISNKKTLNNLGTKLASTLGLNTNASVKTNFDVLSKQLESKINEYKDIATNSETQTKATKEAMQKFVQAFLYMQEETPESKQAIINLLSGLNLSSDTDTQEIIEKVLKKLKQDEETKIQKQKETETKIAELKENVSTETTTTTTTNVSETRPIE